MGECLSLSLSKTSTAIGRVSELVAHPHGREVACTVRQVDRENDGYVSSIWSVPLDGSGPLQLTRGPSLDRNPRWSPDGSTLAFLSSRAGTAQVHLLPAEGGEARSLGQLPGAVSDLRWLPDGKGLVVAAAVPVDPDWRGERPQGRAPGSAGPRPRWRGSCRTRATAWATRWREIHLFALDIAGGEHRQLTDGPFDALAFGVAPDGRTLAYVRTRTGRTAHRADLWTCAIDGAGARQVTQDFATVMGPVWSPDGRWIAFTATLEEGDADSYLALLEVATGRVRRIGGPEMLVADPQAVYWEPDARAVLCARSLRGRHQVVRVPVAGDTVEALCARDQQLGGFAPCGDQLVVAVVHPAQPSEVHACPRDGAAGRALSDFNAWWRERTPMLAQTREFDVPDGRGGTETIEGWLLRAEGSSGPLPLLDDVHGGPASYALLESDLHVYWQVLCARGWAVLALNAVGSATYGKEFVERLGGHWGQYDLPQHLAAVRQLQQEGACDARVAIAGKSYGGYLSAWAVGHTDLFRAAVVMAPVGNIETHYGTSDGGYYADPYFMGTSGRFDRELAKNLSPRRFVETATTPTLFLHGAEDERCPKCQSEELFVSLLCAANTPTEMVLYPGEGHHFLGDGKPSVREDASGRLIDWIARHVDRAAPPLARGKPRARQDASEADTAPARR